MHTKKVIKVENPCDIEIRAYESIKRRKKKNEIKS